MRDSILGIAILGIITAIAALALFPRNPQPVQPVPPPPDMTTVQPARARSFILYEDTPLGIRDRWSAVLEETEYLVYDTRMTEYGPTDHPCLLEPLHEDEHHNQVYQLVERNMGRLGLQREYFDQIRPADILVRDDYRGDGIFYSLGGGRFVRGKGEYGYYIPEEMWPYIRNHGPQYFEPWTESNNLLYACIPPSQIEGDLLQELLNRYPQSEEIWEEDEEGEPNDQPMQYALSWMNGLDAIELMRGHNLW
jgi:hypothetical protein